MAAVEREIDLIAVARRQRELLWIILIGASTYLAVIIFTVSLPAMAMVAVVLQFLMQLVGLMQIVRLSAAMRTPIVLRIFYIVLLLMPLISLLVLLLVSGQASSVLKAAGVRVGLMGVPKDEYAKLIKGHCRGCGYDRSGLELLQACPECNRVPQVI